MDLSSHLPWRTPNQPCWIRQQRVKNMFQASGRVLKEATLRSFKSPVPPHPCCTPSLREQDIQSELGFKPTFPCPFRCNAGRRGLPPGLRSFKPATRTRSTLCTQRLHPPTPKVSSRAAPSRPVQQKKRERWDSPSSVLIRWPPFRPAQREPSRPPHACLWFQSRAPTRLSATRGYRQRYRSLPRFQACTLARLSASKSVCDVGECHGFQASTLARHTATGRTGRCAALYPYFKPNDACNLCQDTSPARLHGKGLPVVRVSWHDRFQATGPGAARGNE